MSFGTSGQGSPFLGWLKIRLGHAIGWEVEGLTSIGDLSDFVTIVAIPTEGQENVTELDNHDTLTSADQHARLRKQ